MSKPEAQFTQDWFSRSIPSWQFLLSRMTQKIPHLRVLEVGVFEGKSTCWLLENFCKTPESVIVAIDSFQGGIEHKGMELGTLRTRFESNIATVGSATKVKSARVIHCLNWRDLSPRVLNRSTSLALMQVIKLQMF